MRNSLLTASILFISFMLINCEHGDFDADKAKRWGAGEDTPPPVVNCSLSDERWSTIVTNNPEGLHFVLVEEFKTPDSEKRLSLERTIFEHSKDSIRYETLYLPGPLALEPIQSQQDRHFSFISYCYPNNELFGPDNLDIDGNVYSPGLKLKAKVSINETIKSFEILSAESASLEVAGQQITSTLNQAVLEYFDEDNRLVRTTEKVWSGELEGMTFKELRREIETRYVESGELVKLKRRYFEDFEI